MKKIFIIVIFSMICYHCYGQGVWTQKANFGGGIRNAAVGFSIGNKGYIGTGENDFGTLYSDFWEYNPTTNTWTQKANFGGGARTRAVGFSIGNKGYIGTGAVSLNNVNDFCEYNPTTNSWTQKANFGGSERCFAVGFSIGNKGYIGTGHSYIPPTFRNDFWEYDPDLNLWTQKADFGGIERFDAVGFSIGNKGYIGTGLMANAVHLRDFWEYNQSTDSWAQKENFLGAPRMVAVGFSIGNKGYIGTGTEFYPNYFNDFYEYNPTTNSWTQKANFGGSERFVAVGFSINNKGYIGTGGSYGYGSFNDFWEYNPNCNPIISSDNMLNFNNLLCNQDILDTIWIKNTGCWILTVSSSIFQGTNASEFSLVSPSIPFNINYNDSIMCIIQMMSSTVGTKLAAWVTHNNIPTSDSILTVNITGRKDTLNFSVNNIFQDTIILEFGSTCTNTPIDTILQIQNHSSKSTYFNRSNIQNPFQIVGTDPFTSNFKIDTSKILHLRFVSLDTGIFIENFTINDLCGHFQTIILRAENRSAPNAVAGFDQNICLNDSTIIGDLATGGTPPYNYNWTPTAGLVNPNLAITNASPSTTTDYILRVTDATGCVSRDTVRVIVNPKPLLELIGNFSVCEGQTYLYNIPTSSGTTKKISVNGATNVDSSQNNILIITWGAIGTGSIKLIQTINSTGCTDSVTQNIIINPKPQPDILGIFSSCSYQIQNYYTSKLNLSNQWSVTGGSIVGKSDSSSVNILWFNSSNAHLKLVQTNSFGCKDSLEQDINIIPTPTINLNDNITLCTDSVYNLNPTVSNAEPYTNIKWTPSTGLDNPDILNPNLSLNTPGDFKYYLTVTSSNGCVGIDSISVKVRTQPELALSKDFIDFGTLDQCLSIKDDSLEITNNSTEDVTINNITQQLGYNIISPPVPFLLKSGWKKKIIVRYTALKTGIVSSDLIISGVPCNFIKILHCTANKDELYVSSDLSAINFGQSLSCFTANIDTVIILKNTSSSNIKFYFDKINLFSPFSLNYPQVARILNPKDTIQIKLNYNPVITGNFAEELMIPYESGLCVDTFRISLSGQQIEAIASSNFQDINFSDLLGCEFSRDSIFNIQNTGTNNLKIISIEPDSVFSTSQINTSIPAGENKDIIIKFAPKISGNYSGKLIIKYEPCEIIDTFYLLGNKQGVSFNIPDSIDFGELVICKEKSKTLQFNIENKSSSNISGLIKNLINISPHFSTNLKTGDSIININTYDIKIDVDSTMPDGDIYGTLDFLMSPCDTLRSIKLHARKSSVNLNYTQSIDFKTVDLSYYKDDTIHIKNLGARELEISSLDLINPPFEILKTIPNIPTKLLQNQELLIIVRFTPKDTNLISYDLKTYSNDPCDIIFNTNISGKGNNFTGARKSQIYVESGSSETGKTISLPLVLRSSENLIKDGNPKKFFARIEFNSTILEPNFIYYKDSIFNNNRYLEFTDSISVSSGIMKNMSFNTALGNSKCTDLIIDTLIWINSEVEIEKENGTYCITNICTEGGNRLLNPSGKVQLISVRPNPTNGEISIEYELTESGQTELILINTLGEIVKEILYSEIKDFGIKSEKMNLEDLSSGQYLLILKTPTVIESRKIYIIK